ncbi:leucine-rich repeat-containing protein 46-like [Mya arenaria]|uniref:leucine-rich repeat-containing protein 46-like n=1 Tax=Mya arenaria TaxID=6604 RepID=UPI0022E27943|nr:leucine-rich repeat-containing protein 46-like [Mya arenaria]
MESTDLSAEKEPEEKPMRLSLHMICKRHLPPDAQKWDQDKIIEALNKITHVRLDRERIPEIDSLELLGKACTNLYLQSNLIERIENLDCLVNLTFISLANNRIRRIENLQRLQKLLFLDVSENQISQVEKCDVPPSVIILNLKGNPCTSYPNYRQKMIADFPQLRQLDLCELTNADKREAGLDAPSDSDEDDDDDEEEEDEQERPEPDNGHSKHESFPALTAGIMLRSQRRAEDLLCEHKLHTSQLDELRISWNVPPSARTARASIPD